MSVTLRGKIIKTSPGLKLFIHLKIISPGLTKRKLNQNLLSGPVCVPAQL